MGKLEKNGDDAGTSNSRELLVVAVGDGFGAKALVQQAEELARGVAVPWEVVHIETPRRDPESGEALGVTEALEFAASHGATISNVVAASFEDGLATCLADPRTRHLVLSLDHNSAKVRAALVDRLAVATDIVLHVYPQSDQSIQKLSSRPSKASRPRHARDFAVAIGAATATLLVAELLGAFIPVRSLDLLFLFPVIAVAARLGLAPALFAGVLSVFAYNYFLLAPTFAFDPWAAQNLVMSVVLFGVAAYTSMVTSRLRARLVLSDRSARENAEIAAFGQRLTRDSDWEGTARTVCDQVSVLFGVHAAVFREVSGKIVLVGASQTEPELNPVDFAALQWCWDNVEPAGAGTVALPAANWQFQPLATSLGMLAVLALARDDGRDPVLPQQRLLLSTLISQAALAHERLRLEEKGLLAVHRPSGSVTRRDDESAQSERR